MMPPPAGASTPISVPEPVPKLLRDLVHERLGLYFEPSRFDTMLEKIEPRAVFHQCPSYLDYYYILKYDARAPEEWRRLMDAFSVQETYFWREVDQIRLLVDEIVPEWFARESGPLRIWSAACATGEEPYSIAMALAEAGWGDHPIEIVASDASESALAKAESAVYRDRSFRALPPGLRERYFEAEGDGFRLRRAIARKVSFRWANLVDAATYDDLGHFPVIFCRNVFIYFSPTAIRRVVDAFADRMPPDGDLFVGASESLLKVTERFELVDRSGTFVYVHKGKPDA
jgi:chemotaxis protein methyltransferase CheR